MQIITYIMPKLGVYFKTGNKTQQITPDLTMENGN
jgi:hypothetical protein